jgi:acetylornithine deacetylase/succinyl-diaminopimelate desuccinylase-like protein
MRELMTRLDAWREEQIDFLARLVNQDSGTDDRDDVNQVGEMLAAPLADVGFTGVDQDDRALPRALGGGVRDLLTDPRFRSTRGRRARAPSGGGGQP